MHTFQLYDNVYKHLTLFRKHSQISHSNWPEKGCRILYCMEVEAFLALDMSSQSMALKKSTISHLDSVLGLFATRKIGKGTLQGTIVSLWSMQT